MLVSARRVFTKNPQRRTLFKDENWKAKYAYQIANDEVKFATPSKTLEEIKIQHIQTVGLQRKYDADILYRSWVLEVDECEELIFLPYDDEIQGHKELEELFFGLPNFDKRGYTGNFFVGREKKTDELQLLWKRDSATHKE